MAEAQRQRKVSGSHFRDHAFINQGSVNVHLPRQPTRAEAVRVIPYPRALPSSKSSAGWLAWGWIGGKSSVLHDIHPGRYSKHMDHLAHITPAADFDKLRLPNQDQSFPSVASCWTCRDYHRCLPRHAPRTASSGLRCPVALSRIPTTTQHSCRPRPLCLHRRPARAPEGRGGR